MTYANAGVLSGVAAAVAALLTAGCSAAEPSAPISSASAPTVAGPTTAPASTLPPQTAPPQTPPPMPSAPVRIPDLAPDTIVHIGIVAAAGTDLAGFSAYRLTLDGGATAWAVRGQPEDVVPELLEDSSYREGVSAFYRAGGYVIYFPDESKAPSRFRNHTGARPGMSLLDTDSYQQPS